MHRKYTVPAMVGNGYLNHRPTERVLILIHVTLTFLAAPCHQKESDQVSRSVGQGETPLLPLPLAPPPLSPLGSDFPSRAWPQLFARELLPGGGLSLGWSELRGGGARGQLLGHAHFQGRSWLHEVSWSFLCLPPTGLSDLNFLTNFCVCVCVCVVASTQNTQ